MSHPSRVLVYAPPAPGEYAQAIRDQVPSEMADVRAVESPADALVDPSWPEIFVGAGVDPGWLLELTSLKWVQWVWAGVDSLLTDLPFATALARRRLALTRAVGVFGPSIAEHVLTWCLYFTKDIPRVLDAQRRRSWERFRPGLLAGSRLGVAGLGSVGREIARVGRSLGLDIWGLRRDIRRDTRLDLGADGTAAPVTVDRVFGPEGLIDFASGVDFLVLTLPLTRETHHMFSAPVLDAMKPASVLINVGRGALLDEAALVSALRRGRPGAAALDVFSAEPLPPESELWSLPNAVVTPHLGAITRPADIVPLFTRNLSAFRAGRALEGLVDPELGY